MSHALPTHVLDTASTPASSVQYRGLRTTVLGAADAARQAREDADGGSGGRRPRGRTLSAGRASSLPPLSPCLEDVPRLSLHHSNGHYDSSRLLVLLHYDPR
ncbi:unnamed protein product [Parnassius mnemosyne]|uniref:Uncharacterized protein n=1 Tax=Parnassius mnemosyne TaxID=213953 RepID=A0AAV1M480_9NEOP